MGSLFLLFPYVSYVLLLLSFSTTTIFAATNNLVDKTCKESSKSNPNIEYSFCSDALQSDPSSNRASLARLGLISIKLAKNYVNSTKSSIKGLMKNKGFDKGTKAALSDCLELYSDAISTVKEAANYYKAKKFGDANVKISAVMDYSSTCEQGFEDLEVDSPLTKKNGHTFQLCAIALSIMNKLH